MASRVSPWEHYNGSALLHCHHGSLLKAMCGQLRLALSLVRELRNLRWFLKETSFTVARNVKFWILDKE